MENKRNGFTIIELIVVIAIIAVLASIVMVNVTSYIQKSRVSSLIANFKEFQIVSAKYYEETGAYTNVTGCFIYGGGACPSTLTAETKASAQGIVSAVNQLMNQLLLNSSVHQENAESFCWAVSKNNEIKYCVDTTTIFSGKDCVLSGSTYLCKEPD